MYLLDTTHCSKLIDKVPTILQKLREHANDLCATCTIVRGELTYAAENSRERESNTRKARGLLDAMEVYPVDDDVADNYGHLKKLIFDTFGARNKSQRTKQALHKIGFGENDLWIAAVAMKHNAVIVSGDGDFRRMQELTDLSVENWV